MSQYLNTSICFVSATTLPAVRRHTRGIVVEIRVVQRKSGITLTGPKNDDNW